MRFTSQKKGKDINLTIKHVVMIYTMAINPRVQPLVFKQALKMHIRRRNILEYVG